MTSIGQFSQHEQLTRCTIRADTLVSGMDNEAVDILTVPIVFHNIVAEL
jgi:hypothetical protein